MLKAKLAMRLPNPDKLALVYYPDPALKRTCRPVTEFGPKLQTLTDRMLALMREAKGVGLAAPQLGLALRIFVCNPTGEPQDDFVCVNPQFLELSGSTELPEGCLSLPGVSVTVRRAAHARMQGFDVKGEAFEITGADLRARIWQHETDHLDGRLIIDRMSAADEIANHRALKQLQADYRPPRRR